VTSSAISEPTSTGSAARAEFWQAPDSELGPGVELRQSVVGSGAIVTGRGPVERSVIWPAQGPWRPSPRSWSRAPGASWQRLRADRFERQRRRSIGVVTPSTAIARSVTPVVRLLDGSVGYDEAPMRGSLSGTGVMPPLAPSCRAAVLPSGSVPIQNVSRCPARTRQDSSDPAYRPTPRVAVVAAERQKHAGSASEVGAEAASAEHRGTVQATMPAPVVPVRWERGHEAGAAIGQHFHSRTRRSLLPPTTSPNPWTQAAAAPARGTRRLRVVASPPPRRRGPPSWGCSHASRPRYRPSRLNWLCTVAPPAMSPTLPAGGQGHGPVRRASRIARVPPARPGVTHHHGQPNVDHRQRSHLAGIAETLDVGGVREVPQAKVIAIDPDSAVSTVPC